MTYKIYRHPKGVYKKFSGFVNAQEFLESMFRIYEDPDFDRFAFSINDFTEITSFSFDEKDMRNFTAHRLGAALTANIFVAFITTHTHLISAINDYRLMSRSATPTEIFPTLEQALQWLKEQTGLTIALPEQLE